MLKDNVIERQDNEAELELINQFQLIRVLSRMSVVDAHDNKGNPFQLKATSKLNGSYSTVRDLGPETIDKFLSMYFIFAGTDDLTETWFLAPEHMEGWCMRQAEYFDRLRPLMDEVLEQCAHFRPELDRILKNGIRRNDPNIPKSYIRDNGIRIVVNHADMLGELVDKYPLQKMSLVFNKTTFHTEIFG